MNLNISYEREQNKSFLKIPVGEETYDEKILLKRTLEGALPMKKTYEDEKGICWFEISGKQDLETYSKWQDLDREFLENLFISICKQVEILEWNLVDEDCLLLYPEFIFLGNGEGERVKFLIFPQKTEDFSVKLRKLTEYILTKIGHGNRELVTMAYHIYDMTISDSFALQELQKYLEAQREKKPLEYAVDLVRERPVTEEKPALEEGGKKQGVENYLENLFDHMKDILQKKPEELLDRFKPFGKEEKKGQGMVVYPEDEPDEEPVPQIHPTVCLGMMGQEPQGMLVYEGGERYPDYTLEKTSCLIGKSKRCQLCIGRETVSMLHARIDYDNETYYLEDMNSTNSTFVNEEVLNYREKRELKTGDILRFADVKYRFL